MSVRRAQRERVGLQIDIRTMNVRTHVTYVRTYVKKKQRTYVRKYLRTYVRTYLRTYVTCERTYVRTYMRTHTHVYVHTYVHLKNFKLTYKMTSMFTRQEPRCVLKFTKLTRPSLEDVAFTRRGLPRSEQLAV